jgi:hypothetical protein
MGKSVLCCDTLKTLGRYLYSSTTCLFFSMAPASDPGGKRGDLMRIRMMVRQTFWGKKPAEQGLTIVVERMKLFRRPQILQMGSCRRKLV